MDQELLPNNKTVRAVMKAMDFCISAMAFLAAVLVCLLTLQTCVAVLLRYYFQLSVGWSTELLEYYIFMIVMLGSPWVLRHDNHVTVDVVVNMVPPVWRRRFAIFTNFLGFLVGMVFVYYGGVAVHENFVKGTLMVKILPMPRYLPLSLVPLMSFFVAYEFLKKTVANYRCRVCVEEAQDDMNIKLRDGA